MVTEWPSRSKRSLRCEPMKPAPPVTRIFIRSVLSFGCSLAQYFSRFHSHLLPGSRTSPCRNPQAVPSRSYGLAQRRGEGRLVARRNHITVLGARDHILHAAYRGGYHRRAARLGFVHHIGPSFA